MNINHWPSLSQARFSRRVDPAQVHPHAPVGLQGGERALTVDHAGLIAALTATHDRVIGAL